MNIHLLEIRLGMHLNVGMIIAYERDYVRWLQIHADAGVCHK